MKIEYQKYEEIQSSETTRFLSLRIKSGKKTTMYFKENSGKTNGKANKSAGRMPWHWEPKKDVVNCDKLR